eukprot:TRINITY_DN2749_c0_g1_i1.p1 TRINITY_DN2749_c0_g1~~TRINITY_DN2749_c0_g1_i1.p1  ORF type:complete len:255 (+),score=32.51 TRINITY_DN2749_c0_g1_i1:51-815(+)
MLRAARKALARKGTCKDTAAAIEARAKRKASSEATEKTKKVKAKPGLPQWPGCVIVGLGNPDAKYSKTRHNAGFMVLDEYARRHNLTWDKVKTTRGLSCSFEAYNRSVHLLKPMTYMNLSGESLSKYLRHIRKSVGPGYQVTPANVLVVHDFLDQPFGQLKLKTSGSAGGHNGLRNIQLKLSSSSYHRLRVGIGRPDSDTARFVLQPFSGTHRALLPDVIDNACKAIDLYLHASTVALAMNEINQRSGNYQIEI